MTKAPNPLNSDLHSIVQLAAAFFLIMAIVSALSTPPADANFGQSIGQLMGQIAWTLAAASTACIGLAISATAMRKTKAKQKTGINKEAAWYLLFYFIVLTLPILLTIIVL